MSLFSSRQWWHTRLGSGEEFDQGSICVANVDNDPIGTVKIITGSLQGVLRVHQPHQQGYSIEDILLEAQLNSSILQLAAGNFLGGTSLCLAVLHPRKLSVYTLQAVGSSYLQLSKLYEHALEHTAANLAYGPFGGVTGVDHIVVQSYDGQLTFFEQEVQSFSRLLPDFLLPGPMAYLTASDSFVTTTAGLELVAYRYNSIAAANWENKQQQGASGSGKRIHEDWKVVLGESALDIKVGNVSTAADGTDAQTAPSILVLSEHTFFILDLSGHILVQRRLDHHPSCFWPYPASTDTAGSSSNRGSASTSSGGRAPAAVQVENLLIATHSKALQVYRGQQLAWAAQLDVLPVAVRVTSLVGVKGMIVALDDAGSLSILYLGTEPPKQTVAYSEAKLLDYTAMEQERLALLSKLKAAGGAAGLDAAAAAKAEAKAGSNQAPLLLKAKVPNRLDSTDSSSSSISGGFGAGLGGGIGQPGGQQQQQQLTAVLTLSNTTTAALQDVSISVLAPAPVEAEEVQLSMPQLPAARRGAAATPVQLVFQQPSSSVDSPAYLPSSNMAQVVVTYKQADGQPGAEQLSIHLPMCLFCQVIPPVKEADFKLTLSTNREAVQVMELFADMVAQVNPAYAEALARSQAANMLSFRYPGGQTASILVSKNGGRYRLQGSCLEAMWLVLQELQTRLAAHFAAVDKKPQRATTAAAAGADGMQQQQPQTDGSEVAAAPGAFQMTSSDALPVQDVFDLVDRHFAARTAISSIDAQLEQQEVAFRSIQKRLLVRYKDKNAAPLNQLDVLMEEVYEHIMELADKLATAQEQLLAAGQALGAGVQLLLLLCKLQFGLSQGELQVLSSCLSPVVHDGLEVGGWEEMTEAAMTQLLRTSLARSQKDAAASVPFGEPVQDTARLRKHISLVLERLAKGMRLEGAAQLA